MNMCCTRRRTCTCFRQKASAATLAFVMRVHVAHTCTSCFTVIVAMVQTAVLNNTRPFCSCYSRLLLVALQTTYIRRICSIFLVISSLYVYVSEETVKKFSTKLVRVIFLRLSAYDIMLGTLYMYMSASMTSTISTLSQDMTLTDIMPYAINLLHDEKTMEE